SNDSRRMVADKLYAAVLTPPGRGAIATVRVWGPGAVQAVSHCFLPASGRPLASHPIGKISFGQWVPAADETAGEELVVCRLANDTFEVHCHGGQAAVA